MPNSTSPRDGWQYAEIDALWFPRIRGGTCQGRSAARRRLRGLNRKASEAQQKGQAPGHNPPPPPRT